MNYKIIFSKRRTISLSVTRDAELVVRAPQSASVSYIEDLVVKRKEWIEKALERQLSSVKKKTFSEGEMFLFLGKEYPLRIVKTYRSRLEFLDGFFLSEHKLPVAKKLFEQWYKTQAKKVVTERLSLHSQTMGLSVKKITIRNTSSRWGSCSSLGNVNFSYRLVLAPIEILDYVVVHELAHLVHQNHSSRFGVW